VRAPGSKMELVRRRQGPPQSAHNLVWVAGGTTALMATRAHGPTQELGTTEQTTLVPALDTQVTGPVAADTQVAGPVVAAIPVAGPEVVATLAGLHLLPGELAAGVVVLTAAVVDTDS
jgi:hypothetical protein